MLGCKAEPPFARSMQFNSISPLPGFHISFFSACFACHWFFDTTFFYTSFESAPTHFSQEILLLLLLLLHRLTWPASGAFFLSLPLFF
jgi:hypothetical protein